MLPDDLNGHRAGFPAVSPPPPPPPAPVMVALADPAVPAGGPASRRSNGRAIGRSAAASRHLRGWSTIPHPHHNWTMRSPSIGQSCQYRSIRRRIPRLHRQSRQRYFRRCCQDLIGRPIARDTRPQRHDAKEPRAGAPDRTPPRVNPGSDGVGPLRRTEPQYHRPYRGPQSRYQ